MGLEVGVIHQRDEDLGVEVVAGCLQDPQLVVVTVRDAAVTGAVGLEEAHHAGHRGGIAPAVELVRAD